MSMYKCEAGEYMDEGTGKCTTCLSLCAVNSIDCHNFCPGFSGSHDVTTADSPLVGNSGTTPAPVPVSMVLLVSICITACVVLLTLIVVVMVIIRRRAAQRYTQCQEELPDGENHWMRKPPLPAVMYDDETNSGDTVYAARLTSRPLLNSNSFSRIYSTGGLTAAGLSGKVSRASSFLTNPPSHVRDVSLGISNQYMGRRSSDDSGMDDRVENGDSGTLSTINSHQNSCGQFNLSSHLGSSLTADAPNAVMSSHLHKEAVVTSSQTSLHAHTTALGALPDDAEPQRSGRSLNTEDVSPTSVASVSPPLPPAALGGGWPQGLDVCGPPSTPLLASGRSGHGLDTVDAALGGGYPPGVTVRGPPSSSPFGSGRSGHGLDTVDATPVPPAALGGGYRQAVPGLGTPSLLASNPDQDLYSPPGAIALPAMPPVYSSPPTSPVYPPSLSMGDALYFAGVHRAIEESIDPRPQCDDVQNSDQSACTSPKVYGGHRRNNNDNSDIEEDCSCPSSPVHSPPGGSLFEACQRNTETPPGSAHLFAAAPTSYGLDSFPMFGMRSQSFSQPQYSVHSNEDSSAPYVSLAAGNDPAFPQLDLRENIQADEAADSSRRGIPQQAYDYLDSKPWVRICMACGNRMEIMVRGIASQEARRLILENTELQDDEITVMTLLSSRFRYLAGDAGDHTITQAVYFEGDGHGEAGDGDGPLVKLMEEAEAYEEDVSQSEANDGSARIGVAETGEAEDTNTADSPLTREALPSEAESQRPSTENQLHTEATMKCLQSSTIGGFLETDDGTQYMVTSGHYSSTGTKYYYDPDKKEEIGTCEHHFWDSQVDVAFVKMNPMPKEKLSNLLGLPLRGHMKTFVPMLSKDNVYSMANRRPPTRVYKDGPKGLVTGNLVYLSVKDASHQVFRFLALDAPEWGAGVCAAGDSGSIIFSIPDICQPHVHAQGLVAGLLTLKRRDKSLKNVCVVSPLLPAIQRIQGIQREAWARVDNFKYISPVMQTSPSPTNTLSPRPRRRAAAQHNLQTENVSTSDGDDIRPHVSDSLAGVHLGSPSSRRVAPIRTVEPAVHQPDQLYQAVAVGMNLTSGPLSVESAVSSAYGTGDVISLPEVALTESPPVVVEPRTRLHEQQPSIADGGYQSELTGRLDPMV